MDNEEYIASGVLELYAAGALTQEEQLEVERMAADYPQVRAALQEACATMEEYARLYAVEPDPELKTRIMEQVAARPLESAPEHGIPVLPAYSEYEKNSSPYKWMFAASIALFLLSGFMSIRFYYNWQDAEDRLSEALASQQMLARNYNMVSEKAAMQDQLLSVIRDETFEPVKLLGVSSHPEARVMVYWSPKNQQVYLDVLRLPAPPAGKQYQLWALDQGKPIDAGMLTIGEGKQAVQQMKKVKTAQAFAVTLEPAGGSVNPTMEEMYAMGEVKS